MLSEQRALVHRLPFWSAATCVFVHVRTARGVANVAAMIERAGSLREAADEHDRQRFRWAMLVRGVRRREARRAASEAPCPG